CRRQLVIRSLHVPNAPVSLGESRLDSEDQLVCVDLRPDDPGSSSALSLNARLLAAVDKSHRLRCLHRAWPRPEGQPSMSPPRGGATGDGDMIRGDRPMEIEYTVHWGVRQLDQAEEA